MRATRKNNALTLAFDAVEGSILREALDSIITNYQTPPDQIDPKVAAVWYSSRGCHSAGLSAEETSAWQRDLHGFKSANLNLLKGWADKLSSRKGDPYELQIDVDKAPTFLTVLNDHRLYAAARHNIGESEMTMPMSRAFTSLPPDRQAAIIQIDLLAWIIEVILRLIAPEAANWMD
jgi:hypothetical protein